MLRHDDSSEISSNGLDTQIVLHDVEVGVVDDLGVNLEVAKHAPFSVGPLAAVVHDVDDKGFLGHGAHGVVSEKRP